MNMENFITGYPGREFQIRQALDETIGEEKAKFFFDKVRSSLCIYTPYGTIHPRVLT